MTNTNTDKKSGGQAYFLTGRIAEIQSFENKNGMTKRVVLVEETVNYSDQDIMKSGGRLTKDMKQVTGRTIPVYLQGEKVNTQFETGENNDAGEAFKVGDAVNMSTFFKTQSRDGKYMNDVMVPVTLAGGARMRLKGRTAVWVGCKQELAKKVADAFVAREQMFEAMNKKRDEAASGETGTQVEAQAGAEGHDTEEQPF